MGQDKGTRPDSVTETDPPATGQTDPPAVSGPVSKKRTEPGLGTVKSSLPAVSMKKLKVETQRGLSAGKAPKVVTKHGLAPPPPTSSAPPSVAPSWRLDPIPAASKVPHFDDAETRTWAHDHTTLEAARDERTPTAATSTSYDREPGHGEDRSLFQTSHGGGKNRISGGRDSARAYVSPTTVQPAQGDDHHTAAVKIHDSVRIEAQRFVTEPSLHRRRKSSLPLTAEPPRRRMAIFWVLVLSLLAGFLSGLVVLWWSRARHPASPPIDPAAENLSEFPENSRNDFAPRPNQPAQSELDPRPADSAPLHDPRPDATVADSHLPPTDDAAPPSSASASTGMSKPARDPARGAAAPVKTPSTPPRTPAPSPSSVAPAAPAPPSRASVHSRPRPRPRPSPQPSPTTQSDRTDELWLE